MRARESVRGERDREQNLLLFTNPEERERRTERSRCRESEGVFVTTEASRLAVSKPPACRSGFVSEQS